MYVINAVGLSGGGVNIFLDFSKVAKNLDVVLLTDGNTKHIADKYFPGKKNIVVKFAVSYFGRFIFHLFICSILYGT